LRLEILDAVLGLMLDDSCRAEGFGTERRAPIGRSAKDPISAAQALDAFGTAGPSVSPSVEQTS
jgi:hypothetical protein